MEWANTLGLGEFSQLLVNWYKDGSHCIGTHADSEADLKPGSPILTISLGATRTFRLRRDGKILMDIPVSDGHVLVMCGEFQRELKHEIPRALRVKQPRISITLRQFI
jgi:alkylated DNA repair dioxygenase AlkB